MNKPVNLIMLTITLVVAICTFPLEIIAYGNIERISTTEQVAGDSIDTKITPDGRYVVFSSSYQLVAGDTDGNIDVYLRDRQNDNIERISLTDAGLQAQWGNSFNANITPDGRYIVFETNGPLVNNDTNGKEDVYVRDRSTQTITRISVNEFGQQFSFGASKTPTISDNGRYVSFETYETSLRSQEYQNTVNLHYQSFVKDMQTGTLQWVSVDHDGDPKVSNPNKDYEAQETKISGDGNHVVFVTKQALVTSSNDGNFNIYKKDLTDGAVALISKDTQNHGVYGYWPGVSSDGRFITFYSEAANIVANDVNGFTDVFLYDSTTETNTLVSLGSNGQQANNRSNDYYNAPRVSDDGRYILFVSEATNLTPNNIQYCTGQSRNCQNIYRRDLFTGSTELISNSVDGKGGNGDSGQPSMTMDGSLVVFTSYANDLLEDDINNYQDVFIRDVAIPYDNTPPTQAFGGNGVVIKFLGQTIQGTTSDDLSGIAEVKLSTGSTELSSTTGGINLTCNADVTFCSWSANAALLPSGANTYTLTVFDRYGNVSTAASLYSVL